MVWNWEIFDDNLINVAQALASPFVPAFRLRPGSRNLSQFVEVPGMKIFGRFRHAEA
jgi:hypothetical protein